MVKVGVVGSISTDFVVTATRRPERGETIFGDSFGTSFGGKGSNQAVAAARLGGETIMFGSVGDDEFGPLLIDNLKRNGIDTKNVKTVEKTPSGSAVITVVKGDNSIIYVAGANGQVSLEDMEQSREVIQTLDIILVQNETPADTIESLIDICNRVKVPLILNPAPARPLSRDYLDKVDYLTPNETEFALIFPRQSVVDVLPNYPNKLIITLGSKGAVYHDGSDIVTVPAFLTDELVDTTGAGDTFNGAFAVAVASDFSIKQAVKFANLASSLSIRQAGAQGGIPTLALMKGNRHYEETWNIK